MVVFTEALLCGVLPPGQVFVLESVGQLVAVHHLPENPLYCGLPQGVHGRDSVLGADEELEGGEGLRQSRHRQHDCVPSCLGLHLTGGEGIGGAGRVAAGCW